MDILDKLLALAQISAGINIKCQLHGDFRLNNVAQRGQGVAHIVLKGRAFLSFEESALDCRHHNQWLEAGDLVFLPRSTAHCLQSSADELPISQPQTARQGGFTLKRFGDDKGEGCELFCLHYQYDVGAELMENLPECLVLHLAETQLAPLVDLLKAEGQSALGERGALGTVSVVNGLSLVLLSLMLRTYLSDEAALVSGVLKGSQDKRLRGLLRAILYAPEALWSVEQMAEFIHVSRSGLIRLFNEQVGISPHLFVHKVRLQQGALLLRTRSDSILAIALSVGFQSETHFGKAFKRLYGVTPKVYRSQALGQEVG